MGKITVVNNITLDGVMQAPARPDEDPRGGFANGGWAIPFQDSVIAQKMGAMMARRRLFPEGKTVCLRLVESLPTPSGVIVATYQAA